MNISLIDSFSNLGHTFIIMSSAMKAAMSTLLDKYTLTGSNYIDWLHNMRTVLHAKSLLHVLEEPVPDEPPINAPQEQIDAFNKYMSQEA